MALHTEQDSSKTNNRRLNFKDAPPDDRSHKALDGRDVLAVAQRPEASARPALDRAWDTVKVFSATKARERDMLGDMITDWLRANPDIEIVDKEVRQSSDSEFHCLSITLFGKRRR